jgi:beta-xylosidase
MMVSNRSTKDQSVTITIHPSALFNSTQGVRFADADLAMTPPGKPRASADDIKNAQKSMEIDLSTENGQADTTSVDELLAGQKRDKNAERLTITSKDNTVTVPVRHNDFRLVEVRINE